VLTPSTLSEMLQRLNGLEEALIDRGVRLLVGKFFLLSSRMGN
jgi:RAD51-like protein 1